MEIRGILISILAPFENHIANGGEKLLGNASSIKRRPDGRVYISGQMQRHALFSALDRLNESDPEKGDTFVSNGDGITNLVERDLRADLGGFMHPSRGDYSGRRTAPLSVTPAVALNPSEIGRDLLIRIKTNVKGAHAYPDGYIIRDAETSSEAADESDQKQALATKEFSEFDLMHMNFFLDVSSLGISKAFKYEKGLNIGKKYFKHIPEAERLRRARLFLQATRLLTDYANQARNATTGEPQQVLIVFDNVLSRKASRYFTAHPKERSNILSELDRRDARYFLGDDKGDISVAQAYASALEFLQDNSTILFDPSNNATPLTFMEAFGRD